MSNDSVERRSCKAGLQEVMALSIHHVRCNYRCVPDLLFTLQGFPVFFILNRPLIIQRSIVDYSCIYHIICLWLERIRFFNYYYIYRMPSLQVHSIAIINKSTLSGLNLMVSSSIIFF